MQHMEMLISRAYECWKQARWSWTHMWTLEEEPDKEKRDSTQQCPSPWSLRVANPRVDYHEMMTP